MSLDLTLLIVSNMSAHLNMFESTCVTFLQASLLGIIELMDKVRKKDF